MSQHETAMKRIADICAATVEQVHALRDEALAALLLEQPTPAPEPAWTPQRGERVRCWGPHPSNREIEDGREGVYYSRSGVADYPHAVTVDNTDGAVRSLSCLFARVEPATPTGGTADEERCPDCGGNGVYPPPYEGGCERCSGTGSVVSGMVDEEPGVGAVEWDARPAEEALAFVVRAVDDDPRWQNIVASECRVLAHHLRVALDEGNVPGYGPTTPTGGTADEEPGVGAVVRDGEGREWIHGEGTSGNVYIARTGWRTTKRLHAAPDSWDYVANGGPLTLVRPATPDPTPQPADPAPDGDELGQIVRERYHRAHEAGDETQPWDKASAHVQAEYIRDGRVWLDILHARGYRQVGGGQVVVDREKARIIKSAGHAVAELLREPGPVRESTIQLAQSIGDEMAAALDAPGGAT